MQIVLISVNVATQDEINFLIGINFYFVRISPAEISWQISRDCEMPETVM